MFWCITKSHRDDTTGSTKKLRSNTDSYPKILSRIKLELNLKSYISCRLTLLLKDTKYSLIPLKKAITNV